jgi:hypothetical protein
MTKSSRTCLFIPVDSPFAEARRFVVQSDSQAGLKPGEIAAKKFVVWGLTEAIAVCNLVAVARYWPPPAR